MSTIKMSTKIEEYHNFELEITNLLEDVAKQHGFDDYNVKKSSGSMKGDGYLGIITAVELSGIAKSKKEILNLVVKSAIRGNAVREKMPVTDAFQREIYMYDVVLPSLQQFLVRKRLPPFPSFAKCYKATVILNSEALILENLKTKGFELWPRQKPMNEEHVALVMKQYGRLHALSFAMKDQDPVEFERLAESLDDIMVAFFDKFDVMNMIVTECKKVVELLRSEKEVKDIFETFANSAPEFIRSLSALSKDHSAILHGDCWANNMMFKYDDETNKNSPTEVCFIDLQVSRLSPPVLDTSYFFYACSSKAILDNFQHYLDLYYDSLADYLKQLGSNPDEVYPREVFLHQWKTLARYGLLVSLTVIKLMLSEQDEVSDLSEFAKAGKDFSEVFAYDIARSNEYNERVKQLVFHFVENGFL